MQPHILISYSSERPVSYETAISAAGGLPHPGYCPVPSTEFDGLVLCGGGDIDPARFRQENCGSSEIDPQRDRAEFALAHAFLSAGKPILGICRGHQVLNVVLGGTLTQDIGERLHSFHCYDDLADRDRVHPLYTQEGSLMRQLYGPTFPSNSTHHQALCQLGDGLFATAWSESGLIEAVEHRTLPVLGVQFHPERMSYGSARPDAGDGAVIFQWFLKRCQGGTL